MKIKLALRLIAAGAWPLAAPPAAVLGQAPPPHGQVLQQIEDRSTGNVWLLVRDPSCPAGPGRLMLAKSRATPQHVAVQAATAEPPVILAGDAVIVEEHTALADVRLQAVALERAARGARFKARLMIGGRVVHAVADAVGRASFAPESETAR